MARRKKMVVRRPLLSPHAPVEQESRGSVAITVGWMLTLLATVAALIVAGTAYLLTRWLQTSREPGNPLNFVPGVMFASAALTGLLCLGLTVVVYRVRREPPPLAITVAAVFVSCLPLATILLRAFTSN